MTCILQRMLSLSRESLKMYENVKRDRMCTWGYVNRPMRSRCFRRQKIYILAHVREKISKPQVYSVVRTESYLYFSNTVLPFKYLITPYYVQKCYSNKIRHKLYSIGIIGLKLCNRRSTDRIESLFLAFILLKDCFANFKRHNNDKPVGDDTNI